MKRIFIGTVLCFVFAFITHTGYAQQTVVEFLYDASGNRILRHVIELPAEKSTGQQQNRETFDTTALKYTELIGEARINIYPNPNGGRFTVALDNAAAGSKTSLALYTVSGALVLKLEQIEAVTEIDIRNRENGPYILNISINGKQQTWKVIKQ